LQDSTLILDFTTCRRQKAVYKCSFPIYSFLSDSYTAGELYSFFL